jgi:hypothetical protein
MNTLQDLNSFSSTAYEFTDNRPAGVTFDRTTPTNGEVVTTQNTTHSLPVGIQILEVINYASAAVTYTINVSAAAGATVTWPTVPSGCTVTNPSTGVYTISGVKSKAIWDIVRSPTVLSPTGVNNDFWQYTATITYNSTLTKSWYVGVYVGSVSVLTTPSNSTYTSGSTTSITGEPQIQYPGSIPTWTVTVTPELTDAVTTLSSAGSGGTSTFNSTTKVLTIVGTKTEVNSHLSTISVQSATNNHWTYNLTYVATNATDIATATKTQQLNSTSTTVLFETVANETYSINQSTTISNGPQINDSSASGFGSYTSTVSAIPSTAISLIDDQDVFQTVFNPGFSQKIIPADIANSDQLGASTNSMAMSSNGNILIIGAPYQNYSTYNDSGAVYIYTRTSIYSPTWTFRAKIDGGTSGITPSNSSNLGLSVAISDGATSPITLAITGAGYVYIFISSDNGVTWSYQTKFYPTFQGPIYLEQWPAESVSISNNGNRLAIKILYNGNTVSSYVYTRSGTTWTAEDLVFSSSGNSATGDISLSGDGNILVISMTSFNATTSWGKFWVFKRVETSPGIDWQHQNSSYTSGRPSLGNPGSEEFPVDGDNFGFKISLSNDATYLAVGAPLDDTSAGTDKGSVWIYKYNSSTNYWDFQTRLQAQTYTTGKYFGYNVKLNSDATVLVITALNGTVSSSEKGSVYIYTRSGTTWTESQVLEAGDLGASENNFGVSLAVNSLGTSLAASCPVEDTSPNSDQGAVYMFTKIANPTSLTWDNDTKTYTIVGNRYATNAILNNLTVTPSTGFDTNFNLIYTTTTPTPATATRNQRVNKV